MALYPAIWKRLAGQDEASVHRKAKLRMRKKD